MENQNKVPNEQINPVSRKTNEEIDEDEDGGSEKDDQKNTDGKKPKGSFK